MLNEPSLRLHKRPNKWTTFYLKLLLSGKICLFILENTNCTNNTNPCEEFSLLIAYELHEYHPDGIRVIRL